MGKENACEEKVKHPGAGPLREEDFVRVNLSPLGLVEDS